MDGEVFRILKMFEREILIGIPDLHLLDELAESFYFFVPNFSKGLFSRADIFEKGYYFQKRVNPTGTQVLANTVLTTSSAHLVNSFAWL